MNTFAFTTVDFFVIGIIAISAIFGLIRGFVKEALSLVSFSIAMYLAYKFSQPLAMQWLKSFPGGATGQMVVAFIAIFILSLVVGRLIVMLITKLLATVGLSFLDRLLGCTFGLLRGLLIVVVLSTLFALTDLPKSNEWRDAMTRPVVEGTVTLIRNWLPADWAEKVLNATDIRQST